MYVLLLSLFIIVVGAANPLHNLVRAERVVAVIAGTEGGSPGLRDDALRTALLYTEPFAANVVMQSYLIIKMAQFGVIMNQDACTAFGHAFTATLVHMQRFKYPYDPPPAPTPPPPCSLRPLSLSTQKTLRAARNIFNLH